MKWDLVRKTPYEFSVEPVLADCVVLHGVEPVGQSACQSPPACQVHSLYVHERTYARIMVIALTHIGHHIRCSALEQVSAVTEQQLAVLRPPDAFWLKLTFQTLVALAEHDDFSQSVGLRCCLIVVLTCCSAATPPSPLQVKYWTVLGRTLILCHYAAKV